MASSENILAFIGSTFHSAWGLEVLGFLLASRERDCSQEEMIAVLRASKGVISQSIAALASAGLIEVSEDLSVRFLPASLELEQLAIESITLYRQRPDMVRRTIVSRTSPGLAAFADAFRWRKD
jgi:hypothetical protein